MYALLLVAGGCATDAGDSSTKDADSPVDAGGGTWTVGPVEPCEAPGTLHYADRSDLVGAGHVYEYNLSDTACVVLDQQASGWSAWVSTPDYLIKHFDLTTGAVTEYPNDPFAQHFLVADLDEDGADDLLDFTITGSILWDEAATTGPLPDGTQVSAEAAAMDLDGDGLDDLVFTGFGDEDDAETGGTPPAAQIIGNTGAHTFATPFSAAAGPIGQGFAAQVLDWEGDGDPDLYVCNDHGATAGGNQILLDDGGDLVIGDAKGADIVTNCMSASFADVDGDGSLDLYLAENGDQHLLLDQDGFVDVGAARIDAGFTDGQMGWSSVITDGDNDGRPDIFVSTGDFMRNAAPVWPVWWLRQDEDGAFADHGADLGLPQETASRGLAAHDVNADGVVDLLIADGYHDPWLLLSESCTADNWIEVSAPAGSKVTVTAGDRTWAALVSRHDGWCGWGPATVHIGLGDVERVDTIKIEAPWTAPATTTDVPARTRVRWDPD